MKKALIVLFALFILFNLWVVLSGKTFFYKALIYNYVNIDDIDLFHVREIAPSDKPFYWPVSYRYNKIPAYPLTDSVHGVTRTVSFLVVKDDSLVHESYYEGYDSSSISNSFSMAKSIVSAAIGAAITDGYIQSVDQPVGAFLSGFEKDGKEKITIRNILQMSSGLSWDESYSSPFSLTTEAYYGKDLRKLIDNLKVISPPGKQHIYLSGDTQILGFIVEKATGKSLSDYLSERIWQPMGAEVRAVWSLDDKDGIEKAYCCVYSSARDFAKFGKLFLDSGRVNGRQLINEEYVLSSLEPCMLPDEEGNPTDYYGFQWWIIPEFHGRKIFYARGILGQYVLVCPSDNLIAVRLGHIRHTSRTEGVPTEIYWYLEEAFNQAGIKL